MARSRPRATFAAGPSRMHRDLFDTDDAAHPAGIAGAGRGGAARVRARRRGGAPRRRTGRRRESAAAPHGHAGRLPDVGGDDQLRHVRLGDGPDRLSLRPGRPGERRELARDARSVLHARRACRRAAGFEGFAPDACLVNRYEPGARLTLHQDKNERDFDAPIVSVSLGIPAVFLFGGGKRSDRQKRIALAHGDVVVWGGPARLRYHGVRRSRTTAIRCSAGSGST